jgi:hypothetical protein
MVSIAAEVFTRVACRQLSSAPPAVAIEKRIGVTRIMIIVIGGRKIWVAACLDDWAPNHDK